MNRDAELTLIERCLAQYHSSTTTSGPPGTADASRAIKQINYGSNNLALKAFNEALDALCARPPG